MRKRSHRVVVYFNDKALADLTEKVQRTHLPREEVIRRAVKGLEVKEAPPVSFEGKAPEETYWLAGPVFSLLL